MNSQSFWLFIMLNSIYQQDQMGHLNQKAERMMLLTPRHAKGVHTKPR